MIETSVQPHIWQSEPLQVQRGDVWQLGRHRLMVGDSTNAEDIAQLMQGEIAQLGLHDPPYGKRISWQLGDGKHHGSASSPMGSFHPVTGDDKPFNPQHLLTSGSVVVIWGANHFSEKLPSSPAWIVWDKRVDLPTNNFSDAEVAWVSTGNRLHIMRHRWMGMIRDSERGIKRVHPTQKPIWLMAQIIEKYTAENDLVTDWYAGSGTTLIAGHRTRRTVYSIEIEPYYCKVILNRFSAETGIKPVLLAHGGS